MRIAYISTLPIADADFSYLNEAMKVMDITLYLFVNPRHLTKSVIDIGQIYPHAGIFDWTIYPKLAKYRDFIDLDRVKIINIPGKRSWQFRALYHFTRLAWRLRREYDVTHLDWLPYHYQWGLLINKSKTLITVHDPLPHSGKQGIILKFVRGFVFRYFRNFLILNNAQHDEFVRTYNINPKNVYVSRLGRYSCLNVINHDNPAVDGEYILFAGRISHYKGIDTLLQAMEKVHQRFPQVKLVVAGGGEFDFDISKYRQADYIELRNRFIPDTELVGLIDNSLFVVCPYRDATQSGVVMSVFAFDKPVVATNVGGLSEMVEDRRFGRIVNPDDPESLADAIIQLLDDRTSLNLYSQNISQAYSIGEYSWRSIAIDLMNNCYSRLLTIRPQARPSP